MNLSTLSNKRMPSPVQLPNKNLKPSNLGLGWVLIAFMAISFIGFLDAAYLTIQHYNEGILPCVVFEGCEEVTTSKFSTVAGIPISLFGAGYYLTILISAITFWDSKNRKAFLVIAYLPMAGFAISIFLLYLQLFVIKAICAYCVVSIISSALLFILGLLALKLIKVRPF